MDAAYSQHFQGKEPSINLNIHELRVMEMNIATKISKDKQPTTDAINSNFKINTRIDRGTIELYYHQNK